MQKKKLEVISVSEHYVTKRLLGCHATSSLQKDKTFLVQNKNKFCVTHNLLICTSKAVMSVKHAHAKRIVICVNGFVMKWQCRNMFLSL